MNALVIAQHHGAFITLESLPPTIGRVVVCVPKSQIEKYSTFDDPIFTDYFKNMKKYCKKKGFELYEIETVRDNLFCSYSEVLKELEATGIWAVMVAGAIYGVDIDEASLSDKTTAFVRGRLFDKNKRLSMYGMIGLPPSDPFINNSNFFLNMDVLTEEGIPFKDSILLTSQNTLELAPMAIARPDPLIGQAISSVECLRIRTKSSRSNILYFWMQCITKKHLEQEFVAYPFDEYGKVAKKVKKYLPEATYNVITENALQSSVYKELAELDL